jgi:hypothetical protein
MRRRGGTDGAGGTAEPANDPEPSAEPDDEPQPEGYVIRGRAEGPSVNAGAMWPALGHAERDPAAADPGTEPPPEEPPPDGEPWACAEEPDWPPCEVCLDPSRSEMDCAAAA